ncbi:hypothetical protein [Azohydromonas caseinilytica]|uniref:Uncharacterized protein n=1 Tax=Azohydromonas caseinilytica TaxID=2728836 RepID=A0A848F1B1_9BURK|nr:hypothetical protein [Azohydromonas caseinilytica]NML13867.1 hypothetical protein [Azohydromonas caseinilytica]
MQDFYALGAGQRTPVPAKTRNFKLLEDQIVRAMRQLVIKVQAKYLKPRDFEAVVRDAVKQMLKQEWRYASAKKISPLGAEAIQAVNELVASIYTQQPTPLLNSALVGRVATAVKLLLEDTRYSWIAVANPADAAALENASNLVAAARAQHVESSSMSPVIRLATAVELLVKERVATRASKMKSLEINTAKVVRKLEAAARSPRSAWFQEILVMKVAAAVAQLVEEPRYIPNIKARYLEIGAYNALFELIRAINSQQHESDVIKCLDRAVVAVKVLTGGVNDV